MDVRDVKLYVQITVHQDAETVAKDVNPVQAHALPIARMVVLDLVLQQVDRRTIMRAIEKALLGLSLLAVTGSAVDMIAVKADCGGGCSGCSSTCQGGCNSSCSSDCASSCNNVCGNRCDNSCVNHCRGCQGQCLDNCGKSCTGTCNGCQSCVGECAKACANDCNVGCNTANSAVSWGQ